MVVCHCGFVIESELEQYLKVNPDASITQIQNDLGACGSCESCRIVIESFLESQKAE